MKTIKAAEMHKNAYDEVLFLAGKEYEVVDEDEKRYWVLNELHSETPVRKNQIDKF